MSLYSLHKTLAPAYPVKVPPINAVLFFDEGTRLASGGDDGVVRIWDVRSGDCQQELTDSRWGQITCLSLMGVSTSQALHLFVGTGYGFVSVFPWHGRTQQFNRQTATHTIAFADVPIESQALDLVKSRIVVGSKPGIVKMYAIKDQRRSTAAPQRLHGGVDVRRIKGASFGEGGRTLICGGDQGISFIYDISNKEIEQELEQQDYGTICALTTCTTRDYHFIASGAGESPALVYIWGKPTERKQAEDKEKELEQQQSDAETAQDAATMARTLKEAELLHAAVAAQDAVIQNLRGEADRVRTQKSVLRSVLILMFLAIVRPCIIALTGLIELRSSADRVHIEVAESGTNHFNVELE
ncbi:WD40-repeat-containing domain protein [Mycena galopus ATCC 62051]|nr:WD40-repeat-containing domain protein [Mycena galopus ATCC 62051]